MPQNDQMVTNGFCSFRWVRWFDELVNGHVGDAATLDGVPASGYSLIGHTHPAYAAPGAVVTAGDDGATFGAMAGAWTVPAGSLVTYAYSLNGTVLTLWWRLDGTTTSEATAALTIRLSDGRVAAQNMTGTMAYQTAAGGWDVGSVEATAGVATIALYTRTRANWPVEAGTVTTRGQLVLEVA
jgi:hypothetical protein